MEVVVVNGLVMGGMFVGIAWDFKDWMTGIFGVRMITICIYAYRTKTRCGYGGRRCYINR